MAPSAPESQRSRSGSSRPIAIMRLALIAGIVAMLVPIGNLQILETKKWSDASLQQVTRTRDTPAVRGGIYDRYGSVLAVSKPTYRLIANNRRPHDPVKYAKILTKWLHIPVPKLTKLFKIDSGYVVLSNSLSVADGRVLKSLKLDGLTFELSTDRSAPNGMLGRSLLGYINATGVGSAGLETQFEPLLAGQSGRENYLSTEGGDELPGASVQAITKSRAGIGLEITLDTALQFITEQALGKQLQMTGAYTGTAIVMDVRTGEILANASLVNVKVAPAPLTPVTDWGSNIGIPAIRQTIMNLGITQVYLPGSVFKVVPFSAALERNLITPETTFPVPYSVKIGTHTFHDAERHGHLTLTAANILSQSSNIGTLQISRQVGKVALLDQVTKLGFGAMTDLGYPGESAGVMKTLSTFYDSDIASLPIGQVNAVTPLQVLNCYNAIANNGVFVQPRLVRGYIHPDGKIVAAPPSRENHALSPRVAATLRNMLQGVVTRGTGMNAAVPGYRVAGKTGTSQIPYPGSADFIKGAYNATFVGFAPADHPVLSMIVVVQRPRTSIFGGVVAAPVFQRVMMYALQHYNIPSTGGQKPAQPGATSLHSDVT